MNRIVPIIVGTAAVLIILAATFAIAKNAFAAPFVYGVGGTGTTTPNPGQVVWWGTANQKGIATGTVTCAGTASCGAGSFVLGSALTITGAAAGSSPFASSSAFTAGQIPYATNTNGTPINLSAVSTSTATISSGLSYSGTFGALVGGADGTLTCTTGSATVFGCLTAANFNIFNNKVATSAKETAGQVAVFGTTNGTPALLYSVATGTISGSTGLSVTAGQSVIGSGLTITNTGVTSITATSPLSRDTGTGAVTISCPTCSTNTFAYPFVYATTYNTLSAGTSTPLWLQGSQVSLFASSTIVFENATSTNEFEGTDKVNNWRGVVSPTSSFVLGTGTTTAWTASTTATAYSPFLVMPFAGTLRQVRCLADQSFLGVNVQVNGSNATPSYFIASTTVGQVKFSAGNTFTAGQKILANFGTTTSAGTLEINCTFDITQTP